MDKEGSLREITAELKKIHHQVPRWIIFMFIISAVVYAAYHTEWLDIVLLLSIILAYILNDVIKRAELIGIRRDVAVAAFFMIMLGIIGILNVFLLPVLQAEMSNFIVNIPKIATELLEIITKSSSGIISKFPPAEEHLNKILKDLMSAEMMMGRLLGYSALVGHAALVVLGMILIPFFSFFLLRDWPHILKTLMRWTKPRHVETAVAAVSEINILAGKYLRGVILDCIIVGFIASVGLWAIGLEYPVSLGIFTGVANLIPYIGPIMSCMTVSAVAFFSFQGFGVILNIIIFYILLKLTDDILIQPLTIGKSVHLHPMLLVIAIIVGEKLFGIMGMILAVPIVTITQKVISILMEQHNHYEVPHIILSCNEPDTGNRSIHIPL